MTRSEICHEFKIDGFDGKVVFADYVYEDYTGDASVIFVQAGKLYHVSGAHCSCNGLEGQWSPEEITIDVLKHMAEKGRGKERETALQALALLDKFAARDLHALEAALALQTL